MTKEQETISNVNKKKAWNYFVSTGQIPENAKKWEYVLHHVDTTLRHTNIEKYIQWNIEDLTVMLTSEHTSLHWTIDYDERRKKISNALTGKSRPDLSEIQKGKKMSQEQKEKISVTLKGRFISEETKRKISETLSGHQVSEETKRKISEANKGKQSPQKGKHWKLVDGKHVYY